VTMQSPASGRLPRPDPPDQAPTVTVDHEMSASADAIYRAWTERFDLWFARPGSVRMRAEAGEPFFFETEHEGKRHPHYGRFLELSPARVVELTWMTGKLGTSGAETVVRLELNGTGAGTLVRLTHSGFYDDQDAQRHREAWPHVLGHLDEQLAAEPREQHVG
jgi:uncharacterized protein YndB with AHSA1/START domain